MGRPAPRPATRRPAPAGPHQHTPHAASPPGDPVPWALYRQAAAGLLPRAAAAPVVLPPASPLRAAAIRWPDGEVSRPRAEWLVAGLAQRPGTPEGQAARQALRAITGASVRPAAPRPTTAELRAAWGAILRQPAFATSRPGVGAALRRTAAAGLGTVGRWLAALVARLHGHGMAVGIVAKALGLAFAGAALLGLVRMVLLVARGWERGTSRRGAAPLDPGGPDPAAVLDEATAALSRGDLAAGVRATMAAALLAAEARYGIAVRPGWTGAHVRKQLRARLDADWPGFGDLVAFHDRVLFAWPDAEGASPEGVADGGWPPQGGGRVRAPTAPQALAAKRGPAGPAANPSPAGDSPAISGAARPNAGEGASAAAPRGEGAPASLHAEAARWIGEVRRWARAR